MAMYATVRRMRLRDGLTISEIARRTSLSRNTIKDWLRGPVRDDMQYRRVTAPKKIGPYETWLRDALATDARRPRRERRTALKLHAQLHAQGFPGSYARVTECVRAWRAAQGAVSARSAFVPLSVALGEAFQFDWSDEGVVIGGVWRKVQLAHMKLCASRAFWLVGYPSQGHEMLFDVHTRCLTGLGGVAGRGIYDNMKTAVDLTPRKDRGRVVNARFAAMAAHYLFEPDFCNVASGWEKGRVEKSVQDTRRRIWQEAQHQRFASFAELNAWLPTQCLAAWEAPRFTAAGAKDDRRDARVLADSWRTDPQAFRRVQLDHPLIVQLREWSRLDDDLCTEVTRLTNQLCALVYRVSPALLRLCPGADEPWLWAVLAEAPTPQAQQRLTVRRVARLLRAQQVRRLTAADLHAALQAPPIALIPGVVDAVTAHYQVLLPRLRLTVQQRRDATRQLGPIPS